MDIINKLMALLPIIIPALIAFNVVLSSLGAFFNAIHLANVENILGKISLVLKKIIDLVQGNVAH